MDYNFHCNPFRTNIILYLEELSRSMSDMMEQKLKPINDRLKRIELTQENDILPRLQNIEACYTLTFKRYQAGIEQIEAMP